MPANWNEELINRLIDQYGDSILRICYLYLKDYHLAEDVTQETLLKAYDKYDTFENRSSEKTWIMRIAINHCKNYMRTHWFKRINIDSIPETSYNDTYDKIMDRNSISLEIMKLSPKYKEVIILYYYQELTVKEISFVLNVKESTILQRLRRAREQL